MLEHRICRTWVPTVLLLASPLTWPAETQNGVLLGYGAAGCLHVGLTHNNPMKKTRKIELKTFFFLKLMVGLNPKEQKYPKRRKLELFLFKRRIREKTSKAHWDLVMWKKVMIAYHNNFTQEKLTPCFYMKLKLFFSSVLKMNLP